MSKIAILTDSNSGITQEEGKKLGIYVVPMPFMIDEKEYFEDINLSQDKFYDLLKSDVDVKTSQPSPESLMNIWDNLLSDYDEIVYIPMSSGLSSSCSSAYTFSQEEKYEDKVFVVDNQRISVTQRQSALDALEMANKGMSASEIRDKLTEVKFESSIYIMLDTLYYLKKGGRITPAAAALGTLLRLKPVLTIQGEKLDAFAKARTSNQGKSIMINAIKKDIEERFGGVDAHDVHLEMAYTFDKESMEEFKKEVEEAFPGYDINVDPLSLSVACHIGPGALAVACSRKVHV
ncbi:MAG: DegV family protein [Butyrivibrio sp.]|nr:DegV family protein [Butyrivibrio sp.]